MEARPTSIVRAAALVLAGAVGAAVALGGAALLGAFDEELPAAAVVDPPARSVPPSFRREGPLSVGEVYRRTAPGVVRVATTTIVEREVFDPFGFGFPEREEQRGLGSGFVINKAGHIVTNYHVVAGAQDVEVSFSNNESMPAEIVGSDPSTDLAVLKVDASSRALTPLPLGNSDTVRVGDAVVAIGNPLGYDRTATSGIVSAIGRLISAPDQVSAIDRVIQTDAPINRGNSGGPLLNTKGEVIGVNTQIATGGIAEGNIGIGFAVPVNTVRNVTAQLIDEGRVEHAELGVSVQAIEDDVVRLFRLPVKRGLLITQVREGSGADEAGLRAGTRQVIVEGRSWTPEGDIIVAADGRELSSVDELISLVAQKKPGDKLRLEIYRGSRKLRVTVTLGRRSAFSPS